MKTSLFFLLDHYPALSGPIADRYGAVVHQSVLAESLGYETVWIAEHHFHQLGTAPNPAVLLAAIAARTSNLRLGPACAVLPMRPTLYTAENYAMVDLISNGRLNLGIGSGSVRFEFEGIGVDVAQAKELYAACLDELNDRFAGAAAGELGHATMNIASVQQPMPPIFVATQTVEGARVAGNNGYSLLTIATPTTPSISVIGDQIRAHRQGLVESGFDADSREAVVVVFGCCAATKDDARSLGAPAIARALQRMGRPDTDPDDVYDKLVDAGLVVVGDPTQAAALMQGFADQGVDRMAFLNAFGALPIENNAESIQLLAKVASNVTLNAIAQN